MLAAAEDKVEQEKQWLLSKIGLIPDHDDGEIFCSSVYTYVKLRERSIDLVDVMDEQKWSSCSWLLLQER